MTKKQPSPHGGRNDEAGDDGGGESDRALALATALESATSEHYEDPVLYDHEYRRRRVDVNYYRALAAGRVAPIPFAYQRHEVLELGCGTGRLLVPLLRDGVRTVGVDRSQPMLRRCAERIAALPPAARARGTLLRADFRRFRLGRRFPLVVAPFNALMHLYTRTDVEAFLACVRDHLAPGGVFAFDVMNPDLEWLTRDPTRRWARTRFKDPRTGRTWFYSTNHGYDAASQINWIRLYYDAERPSSKKGSARKGAGRARSGVGGDLTASGGDLSRPEGSRVVHLAQRQFFPAELMDLLHYNGFSVERFGSFGGAPFDAASESQICRCRVRENP